MSGFSGADGKPEISIRPGRNSKKPTKRHLSLRRFQKALGVAPAWRHLAIVAKSKLLAVLTCAGVLCGSGDKYTVDFPVGYDEGEALPPTYDDAIADFQHRVDAILESL
ncbi:MULTISPECIES: hypothetical protein [unclassified Nostoc]|uniref:hypothetical protein n=1 Tax=unclassified Nostoc TaxID=2593658 RepID=UPI001F5503E1|nr:MULTISPECIES: hypothetical protein [unclassified Nostoc]